MSLFDNLNDQQRQAVETGEGPVLIIAGPGTGKTKTLTARIAYLLGDTAIKPEDIVALTFTNKAAREMRERVEPLLGKGASRPKLTTFHALGSDILTGADVAKRLLTEPERQEIVRALRKPAQLKAVNRHELSLLISRLKMTSGVAASAAEEALLSQYEAALHERQSHDFDDLLIEAVKQLRAGKAPRYAHVLVDEFQDTSGLQYEMLKLLAAEQNIFAIGDPNQSIYAFRGAGAEMFECFREDFPSTKTIALTSNYRSRAPIVSLANAIFPDSPQLVTKSKATGTVQAMQTLNEYSEAAYILSVIEQGIGGSDLLRANSEESVHEPRDYAVLYRTHRAGRVLQEAFASAGLPYQVVGEGSPYERPDIQAIIVVMRYLNEPAPASLPKFRNLSENQVRVLAEGIATADYPSICELAGAIAAAFGLADDKHQQQFRSMLVQFGSDLGAALRYIDDIAECEFYDPTVNAVTLMTIHAAKGLEFGHVFIIAAEEGILPKLDARGTGNIDEERRLFYVALTRAKDTLEMLYTKNRAGKPSTHSRFLQEITDSLLPRLDEPNLQALEKHLKRRAAKRAQISLF